MKKKALKISKKTCIGILVGAIVVCILAIVLQKEQMEQERVKKDLILIEDLKLEIHSEATLLSFVSSNNEAKIISVDEKIDTTHLGKQDLTIRYHDNTEEKEKNFQIYIVDTQAPSMKYQKELTTTVGVKIDLLHDVEVQDNSKENIQVSVEGNYDFNKEGTYFLKYVAIDSSNNKVEEDFTLKVNKKSSTTPKPFITVTQEEIENEKYYIPSNLERYLAYNDGTKTAHEIVTNVNCNIDRPFYTDIQPADISKGYLILVNKYYAVDKNYTPANLTSLSTEYTYHANSYLATEAYDSYIQMINDGRNLGYKLIDTSNFRTYSVQESLFNRYTNQNGLEWALKSSAKPGHSEHETGLASDIVKRDVGMYSFVNTSEFLWLKDNAHKYGFILRYPEGKEYLTGYKYEPWHYRYVGKKVAEYIYNNDIVFEEYYAYFCEYKKEC